MTLNRIALVFAVTAILSSGVRISSAASAPGCPAWGNPGGNSGLRFIGLVSIPDAVALSIAQITDAYYAAFGLDKDEFIAARTAAATAADKNGDGLLCVAQGWGQDLNPNSHWAEIFADLLSPPATEAYYFNDNNRGTSNKK